MAEDKPDQAGKGPRAHLKDKFRRGLMPTETDFAKLIDTMALKVDLDDQTRIVRQHDAHLDELGRLQVGANPATKSLQLTRPLGLMGRYGVWKPEDDAPPAAEHYSSQAHDSASFDEIIIQKHHAPFAAEVMAYMQSKDTDDGERSISKTKYTSMLHAIVLCPKSPDANTPAIQRTRTNKLSTSSIFKTIRKRIIVSITTTLSIILGLSAIPLNMYNSENNASVKQITAFIENNQVYYWIAVGALLVLPILLGVIADQRARLDVTWDRDAGLRLKAGKAPKGATVQWHVTRLW